MYFNPRQLRLNNQRTTVEYSIIQSDTRYNLEELVNKKLSDGWVLSGSMSTRITNYSDYFYQPMTYSEPDIKELKIKDQYD